MLLNRVNLLFEKSNLDVHQSSLLKIAKLFVLQAHESQIRQALKTLV